MSEGKEASVIGRVVKWSAIGFGGLVAVSMCAAVLTKETKRDSVSRAGAEPQAAPKEPPWLTSAKQLCVRYDAAPNDIKKSAVFRESKDALGAVTITRAKGILKRLTTNQGGSELSLAVDHFDAEMKTKPLGGEIPRGSPIYAAASEMSEGQCVVFSAQGFEPASIIERSKVCDTDYYVTFTELGACDVGATIAQAGHSKASAPAAKGILGGAYDKVASDAVAQYEIAKRQGDKMQTCVQAGFVSAAYLQAKNEEEYKRWKATEKTDCEAAGLKQ